MRSYFLLIVVAVFFLAGCGAAELAVPVRTEADVVQSIRQTGVSRDVATCVLGLGKSQFEVSELSEAPLKPAVEAALSEFVAACTRAEDMMNAVPVVAEIVHVDEPRNYGDDPALDDLWDQCEVGDGRVCDKLWDLAPLDSDYEEFGVTCGNRPGVLDCSSLTLNSVS